MLDNRVFYREVFWCLMFQTCIMQLFMSWCDYNCWFVPYSSCLLMFVLMQSCYDFTIWCFHLYWMFMNKWCTGSLIVTPSVFDWQLYETSQRRSLYREKKKFLNPYLQIYKSLAVAKTERWRGANQGLQKCNLQQSSRVLLKSSDEQETLNLLQSESLRTSISAFIPQNICIYFRVKEKLMFLK